jgi:integrase
MADDPTRGVQACRALVGMRRGKALGLRWGDVDWKASTIRIERALVEEGPTGRNSIGTTQTGEVRVVAMTPKLAGILRGWKAEQAEALLALGTRQTKNTPIVLQRDGQMLWPSALTDRFRRKVNALGLPTIRLHDLRRSVASIALDAGVPPTEVAAVLGHTVQMLLGRYA